TMTHGETSQPHWQRLQRRALLVGVVAAGLCVFGYFVHPTQFFRSYLMAYMFWLGVVMGCLALLMIHYLVGGRWGLLIRQVLGGGTGWLRVRGVFFLRVMFGIPELYVWARPAGRAPHELSALQQVYLQVPFFLGRAGFYFAVWLVLTCLLNRWSRQQ